MGAQRVTATPEALAREGLEPLLHAIYQHVAAHKEAAPPEPDPRFAHVAESGHE